MGFALSLKRKSLSKNRKGLHNKLKTMELKFYYYLNCAVSVECFMATVADCPLVTTV